MISIKVQGPPFLKFSNYFAYFLKRNTLHRTDLCYPPGEVRHPLTDRNVRHHVHRDLPGLPALFQIMSFGR